MDDDWYGELAGAVTDSLVQTIAAAIADAGQVWSRQLRTTAEVFSRRLGNPSDLEAVHHKVGLLAQDSVKRSFDQVVTAREGWAGRQHYRAGAVDWQHRRFAGKALRNALGDPEFFEATADGIRFGNVAMLNRRAAQWHRLNFGAGGAGTGSTARVQITWGNVVVATLGFDEPASPGFVVPRGVWVGPEGPVRAGGLVAGSDMFFPTGEAKAAGYSARLMTRTPRATRGIVARNFLDAGLRRIGRELPAEYEGLYRQWWDQSLQGAGPISQVSSTVTAAPMSLGSRIRRL